MIQNRAVNIGACLTELRSLLLENRNMDEEKLIDQSGYSKRTLYSYLLGLKDDIEICSGNNYCITKKGHQLTVAEVEELLAQKEEKPGMPKVDERLFNLYFLLANNTPYGGITMSTILDTYQNMAYSCGLEPKNEKSLRRMFHRDLNRLEEIGIKVNRPWKTGRYTLSETYLPRLCKSTSQAIYINTMLHHHIMMEEPPLMAQQEMKKSFLRSHQYTTLKLKTRIHILNDSLAKPEVFSDKLNTLIQTVVDSQRIKIAYISNGNRSFQVLEPLGMLYKQNTWYLVAKNTDNSNYQCFRIEKILSISPRFNDYFEYPEGFSIRKYADYSWGVLKDDDIQPVILKFSSDVSCIIDNFIFHSTQKILERNEDGSIIAQFNVCGHRELATWILQWGSKIDILEPQSLRHIVKEQAWKILNHYND